MEKNLKDYLPYYIGCRCLNTWFTPDHEKYNAGWILKAYELDCPRPYLLDNNMFHTFTDSIKPILRKLSDITHEEKIELYNIHGAPVPDLSEGWRISSVNKWIENGEKEPWTVYQFHYLLKQGFDLFGLLDAGLAQDEKTLTK